MAVWARNNVGIFNQKEGGPIKNEVCIYWLQGRCNRDPCRFRHEEAPLPQFEQPQSMLSDDIREKQCRKTNRNVPNFVGAKTVTTSTYRGGGFNNSNNQRTQKKVLHIGRTSGSSNQTETIASTVSNADLQARHKVLTAEPEKNSIQTAQDQQKVLTAEPEKNSFQKAQPKQCKYWVTGNCVHGERCKDMHSWFSGSGFTMLTKLQGHNKAVSGVVLPSGSGKLYSGGKDRSIRAWDCNSGQCVGCLDVDGEVGCLVTEGPWLFAGMPNVVKAWDLQNQAEFSLNGSGGLVHCIVVENDMILAGMEDGSILVWKWNPETSTPEPVAMLKEHKGAVCSLVVGANRLYSASRDCTVKVWDIQNMQCMHTLFGHKTDVMSVLCWDKYLLSASLDSTIKVWCATESGTLKVVYEIEEDAGVIALCGVHDAEDKPILLCSLKDNTVRLYELPSFVERGRIFSKQEVQVIQIGIQGLLFTGDATGEVSVWKLLGDPHAKAS